MTHRYDRAYLGGRSHRLITPAAIGETTLAVWGEGTENETTLPVRIIDADGGEWTTYPQMVIQSQ